MAGWVVYKWNVMVLVRCSKPLLVTWLKERIEELKPEQFNGVWTVDAFLYELRSKIENTPEGQRKSKKYFPGYGETTEVETWDLQMLTFVLRNFCNLAKGMYNDLENLRNLRNSLATHRANMQSDGDHLIKQQRLKDVIGELQDHIQDENVNTQIQCILDEVNLEVEGDTKQFGIDRLSLQEWYEQDKEAVEMLVDLQRGKLNQNNTYFLIWTFYRNNEVCQWSINQ